MPAQEATVNGCARPSAGLTGEEYMERETGLEPAALCLSRRQSVSGTSRASSSPVRFRVPDTKSASRGLARPSPTRRGRRLKALVLGEMKQ
jgi:hypothetical protein